MKARQKRVVHQPDVLSNMPPVQPISLGGTGARTLPEAADNLGLVTNDMIGQPNGPIPLNANGKLDNVNMPDFVSKYNVHLDSNSTHINGVTQMTINSSETFTITDLDSWRDYTLLAIDSATGGTISRVGNLVTYNSGNTTGPGGFIINGKHIDITLIALPTINKPSIIYPTDTLVINASVMTANSSVFTVTGGTLTHLSSDWEIATDLGFSNVINSSYNDSINKLSYQVSGVTLNTTLYIRVRYHGTSSTVSDWSDPISFTLDNTVPGNFFSDISFNGDYAITAYNDLPPGGPVVNSADPGYVDPSINFFINIGGSLVKDSQIDLPLPLSGHYITGVGSTSVRISSDGNTIAAIICDGDVNAFYNNFYNTLLLFKRVLGVWNFDQRFTLSGSTYYYCLEMNDAGDTILVFTDTVVKEYVKNAGVWNFNTDIITGTNAYNDFSNGSISGDGNRFARVNSVHILEIYLKTSGVWGIEDSYNTSGYTGCRPSFNYNGDKIIIGEEFYNITVLSRSGNIWNVSDNISNIGELSSIGYRCVMNSIGNKIASVLQTDSNIYNIRIYEYITGNWIIQDDYSITIELYDLSGNRDISVNDLGTIVANSAYPNSYFYYL